jgi:hypothetical protein
VATVAECVRAVLCCVIRAVARTAHPLDREAVACVREASVGVTRVGDSAGVRRETTRDVGTKTNLPKISRPLLQCFPHKQIMIAIM